jgi:hypothetical protein
MSISLTEIAVMKALVENWPEAFNLVSITKIKAVKLVLQLVTEGFLSEIPAAKSLDENQISYFFF